MSAILCPDCEEPIGTVERYCWNCDMPVENPVTVPHPEDTCQRCGGRNPVWWVDSDRYNTAVNRAEIVCPTCFVFAHEAATGMRCVWTLVPDGPFRWIDDDGRVTPFLPFGGGSTADEVRTRTHQGEHEGCPYLAVLLQGEDGPAYICNKCGSGWPAQNGSNPEGQEAK